MPITNTVDPGWKIIVEDGQLSASQASFEPDGSTALIPYRVPRRDVEIAPQSFTGYSYKFIPIGGGGGATLKRQMPQPHPFWQGLWASRVAVQGEAGWDSTDTMKANLYGSHDAYDEYRVEVFYARRPYPIKTDAETTKEQQRWVEKLPGRPYLDIINVQGGQVEFTDGIEIPTGLNFRRAISEIKWTWHEVPLRWALDSSGFATNIHAALGKVNAALWEGFAAETLLFDSVDMDYTYAPTTPQVLDLPPSDPPRYLKVAFTFKYFGEGWNKLLHPVSWTWETARPKNSPAAKLYNTADLDTLFQAVA
jgi:hypothetical protein